MSVITFITKGKKESGQTLSVAAIASIMAIEHNYRILIMSTDFNDNTMEQCFFSPNLGRGIRGLFTKNLNEDISNGLEGLIRIFASNRVDAESIKSYTKPILRNRLDILQSPKTVDYKQYCNLSVYFSQIADYANSSYDMVLVDLSNKIPLENQKKVMDLSSLVVVGLNQTQNSMIEFEALKEQDEFYKRNNVLLSIGKYNMNSKYTAKNMGRYLKERNVPIVIPYNIFFADSCSEGKIIDYLLSLQILTSRKDRDGFFYDQVQRTVERIDYLRQAQEFGLND